MSASCSHCGTPFDPQLTCCPKCGSDDRHIHVTDTIRLFDGLDLQKKGEDGSLLGETSSHADAYRDGSFSVDWASRPDNIHIHSTLPERPDTERDELRAANALATAINSRDDRAYVAEKSECDPPDAWLADESLSSDDPARRVGVEVTHMDATAIGSLGTCGQFTRVGQIEALIAVIARAVRAKQRYDRGFARGTYLVLDCPYPIPESVQRALEQGVASAIGPQMFREVWVCPLRKPAFRLL